ncbi:hypothetical protein BOMU111920_11695 [Bordetella muralis]|jgi:hypothetical protein
MTFCRQHGQSSLPTHRHSGAETLLQQWRVCIRQVPEDDSWLLSHDSHESPLTLYWRCLPGNAYACAQLMSPQLSKIAG